MVIFYWAVSLAVSTEDVRRAVAVDAHQIDYEEAIAR